MVRASPKAPHAGLLWRPCCPQINLQPAADSPLMPSSGAFPHSRMESRTGCSYWRRGYCVMRRIHLDPSPRLGIQNPWD